MDYRIIEKEPFKVIGKVFKVSYKGGEHNSNISKLWAQCSADGTIERIHNIDSSQNMLGLCMDFEEEKEQFSYMIGVEAVNSSQEKDFHTREVPSANWAVFSVVGPMPGAMADVWVKVYEQWFEETGFNHADAPDIEVYFQGDPSAENYKCEAWIPIIKKEN